MKIIILLWLSLLSISVYSQSKLYQNLSTIFEYKEYYNGTRIPTALKENILLESGSYFDEDSLGNKSITIDYDSNLNTIVCGKYCISRDHNDIEIDVFERFSIRDGNLFIYEQYHNDVLFSYITYKNYFKTPPDYGNIQITNNIEKGQLLVLEQLNDSVSESKIYKSGILIEKGQYLNHEKNKNWNFYSIDGQLIKEEEWDSGELKETKEY